LNTPEWEITATTVFCDAVDDEVTLIIYADGTLKCTGRDKYLKPGKETSRAMKKKGRQQGKPLACLDEKCTVMKDYRDYIFKGQDGKYRRPVNE
jgi:hypothetical protein